MARLSISRAWDETRAVFGSDGRLIGAVALALILLPQAIAGAIAPPKELSGQDPPAWIPLLTTAVGLIGLIAQIAIVRLALRRGTSVGEAIAHGARRFLPVFLTVVLLVLAAILIMIPVLLVAAGPAQLEAVRGGTIPPGLAGLFLVLMLALLLIGVRLQLMVPVATEESGGPIRLIRRSWELTSGNYWRMLGFLLIVIVCALVVMLVGAVMGGIVARTIFGELEPLGLGALMLALTIAAVQAAFSAVISVMLARIYAQLAGAGQLAEPSVPSSGT